VSAGAGSEFRILGPLEVAGVASLGGPRQRALLARLLLSPGEPVPEGELVDAVWEERPPAGAARSLQVYASRLRGLVAHTGAEIRRRGTGYELVLGPARLDASAFARGRAEAARRAGAGDPAGARTALEEALALWRGPALVDVPGALGAPLDEARLVAAEELSDLELAAGGGAELVPELERRAREQPLRERTRAQLMLALYRSGRQADALAAYRACRAALDELGLEPGEELRELERRILRHDPTLAGAATPPRPQGNLPAPVTGFVGRAAEVAELVELLRTSRLVTLTGTGGIGKTRLALEVAGALGAELRDGAWFVPLAPLAGAEHVEAAIGEALDIRDAPLDEGLAGREALLVLDNWEHVLDAAPLVSRLLSAAPGLRVLATSRVRLDLYGEHEVPVGPLAPEDAAQLFLERARAARHGFEAGDVAELCERLDRLPLALELVAARARELGADELLAAAGLGLATGGPRDLPERQRALASAIAWSENLLSEEERRLFAALGVFSGGFERDAVAAVAPNVAERLGALVDAALVRREPEGRLRLLATVREYALARLADGEEERAVRDGHLAHYAALAERLAPLLLGRGDAEAHATLERERDNLRAALAHARESGDAPRLLGLVRDLSRFWYVRGATAEAAGWFEAALALDGAPPLLRGQALKGAALIDWRRAELDLAEARALEARALLEHVGERRELLGVLSTLGAVTYSRGDLEGAGARFTELAELAREAGERSYLSIALGNAAGVHYELEEWAASGRAYEESLAVARELGSQELEAFAVYGLGAVQIQLGELESARTSLAAGLGLFRELGFEQRMASVLTYLAACSRALGDDGEAARLLGASAALRGSGTQAERIELENAQETRRAAEAALGPSVFAAAHAEGESDPERVILRALAGAPSTLGA
jgi:predicted ATPase/DNA-binding SARP family transcriptional activator